MRRRCVYEAFDYYMLGIGVAARMLAGQCSLVPNLAWSHTYILYSTRRNAKLTDVHRSDRIRQMALKLGQAVKMFRNGGRVG